MMVFALDGAKSLGKRVADICGVTLACHEERDFDDGEHKARPLESVRGRDVYVIQILKSDRLQSVDDRLCRLLFFLATIRDAGAERVTAVLPYLAYSRKDRQTKSRDPVTTRYLATLLEAVGIDAVMCLDVHNLAAFQNSFRCQSHHLNTRKLFAGFLHEHLVGDDPLVVASPDIGGVKRAQLFQETLAAVTGRHVGAAFLEKRRSEDIVSGSLLVGDVHGATVFLLDDMISSGGTIAHAIACSRKAGANKVYALATHALFGGSLPAALSNHEADRILVTDSTRTSPTSVEKCSNQIEVISVDALLANAMRRLHENGSLVELLDPMIEQFR